MDAVDADLVDLTTFAAIFGILPIAIGAGAALRQPLGVAAATATCAASVLPTPHPDEMFSRDRARFSNRRSRSLCP
jgi:hypothetical protein